MLVQADKVPNELLLEMFALNNDYYIFNFFCLGHDIIWLSYEIIIYRKIVSKERETF